MSSQSVVKSTKAQTRSPKRKVARRKKDLQAAVSQRSPPSKIEKETNVIKDGLRATATSKMERFVIIVNG